MRVELPALASLEYDDFFSMLDVYFRELDPYDPLGPDRHSIEQYRRAILADMEGRELLWIVADGERVGLAMVRTVDDWPDAVSSVAEIAEFYVAPTHRRRGIGRAAVESLLAEHRRRGTALVEAAILRDNEGALAFWAGLGFVVQSLQTARRP
jgi:ribosomal protein S18 acetylase RimI-like enzyme